MTGLERRQGLRPVSDKRAARLAAEGVTYIGSTLARSALVSTAPTKRASAQRVGGASGKPKPPADPTPETVAFVWQRDGGRCICCGVHLVWAQRGEAFGWSLHHRIDRSLGGSNDAGNLVLLAGSGTTRCHGDATDDAAAFRPRGLVLRSWQDPLTVVVEAWDGRWLLDNLGDRRAA